MSLAGSEGVFVVIVVQVVVDTGGGSGLEILGVRVLPSRGADGSEGAVRGRCCRGACDMFSLCAMRV